MDVRALRYHGVADLRLATVGLRPPGPGEVVLDVGAAGVCGSDLHFLDGTARPGTIPVTLGHEVAGTVRSSNDPRWSAGDEVAVIAALRCGACRQCAADHPNLCERLQIVGVDVDGGMADGVVVPADHLVTRPPTVPVAAAAVAMDAGVTAYHAVARRGGVAPGDAVAVIGMGGLGTFGLQIAQRCGAAPIVAIDVDPAALERALSLGADEAVLAGPGVSVGREVKMLTDGGVDVAVEFVGGAASVDAAIKALRPGGIAVVAGVGNQPLHTVPPVLWSTNEYELRGAFGGQPGDAALVLGWLSDGSLQAPPLLPVRLEEAAPPILAAARGERPGPGRLVVCP